MDDLEYILTLDQGTTSTRALAFNLKGEILASSQIEIQQFYPKSGYVEHDAEDIWQSSIKVIEDVTTAMAAKNMAPATLGITNQRETIVLWDSVTGEPIAPAIVWQDRRTKEYCNQLHQLGLEPEIQRKTGLLLDPYFSASKLSWALENIPNVDTMLIDDRLRAGTIESYLVFRLTGGRVHITDATNASRTMLMALDGNDWDQGLLDTFSIPKEILPRIVDCAGHFGEVSSGLPCEGLTITGLIGDQQSAAVGQGCFNKGDVKSTYGTGAFILACCENEIIHSKHRLLTTVALQINGQRTYALEGSIFNAGTVVQWFRDDMNFIDNAAESEALARSVEDSGGVIVIPAFTGLGAPHWDSDSRGMILGIERSTSKAQIVRAGLESVAFQTCDLLEVLKQDINYDECKLVVDGGMSSNGWFLEFLSSTSNSTISSPKTQEATAYGAALVAAFGADLIKDISAYGLDNYTVVKPQNISRSKIEMHYKKWKKSIQLCLQYK